MAAPDHAAAPPFSALARYFEISLYLLLLTSVLTLVSTGKLDLVSTLLPPVALLVKGYGWWRGRPPELSQRAANWLVIAYICFFPVDLWWASRLASADAQNPALYAALLATVHLMLFAMIVRLFSARTARDYLFLALLACSTMLAAAILTVDTVFLAFFLVFLALCVSTFIGLEMQRSAERSTVSRIDSGTPAARRLHRALGVTSGAVAVSALLIGTTIFFLLPRFRAGYLSGFRLQPELISGFSDDVELGQIGQIKQSNAVVMRVKIEGGAAIAAGIHWRGIALTTFDGRRWYTESPQQRALSENEDQWIYLNPPPEVSRRASVPLGYTVYLEPLASDALFVAAEPVRLRGQLTAMRPRRRRSLRRSFVMMDRTGSLSNPFHDYSEIRYEAVSDIPRIPVDALRAARADYSESVRETYLQLPALDPRIPVLAQQITALSANAFDRARALESYLQSRYGYTLDLSGPPPADPLAHFLFERRAGHCEYFAAAMTVMLRSLGIPARYVNGFLPGEYNDVAGDFIVRARDAHSWVEAYFPGYGWITFDPTPAGEAQAVGLLDRLTYYWDWFELQWSEWVINYDFIRQYTLAQDVGRASRQWSSRLHDEFEELREAGAARLRGWQASAVAAPSWLMVLLGALAVLVIVLSNRALRAWLRERLLLAWRLRAGGGPLSPDAAVLPYRRMLRLLERQGWRKSPTQTPLEFAASLAAAEFAAPVTELTKMYQAARFGGRGGDASRFVSLLGSIEAALRNRPAAGSASSR